LTAGESRYVGNGQDADFRLTVWNGGAERLYEYAAGEVLGRDARAGGRTLTSRFADQRRRYL
jgi:hypothetical protein